MTIRIFDKAKVTTRRITDEGFLEVTAKVGRPGIQEYVKGFDFKDAKLPKHIAEKPDGTIIRLLRPETEVFDSESMASFEGKPVTNKHPAGALIVLSFATKVPS